MEYVYAALLLHKAGKPVDETGVTSVLKAAGVEVNEARVKALVASSGGASSVNPQSAIPQMITQIEEEEVLRRFATEKDVAASEDEINTDIATRMGLSGKDDPNFQTRFQEELAQAESAYDPTLEVFETLELKPKKGDVLVKLVALAWVP